MNTGHGIIDIDIDGDIIIARYIGLFNVDGMERELTKLRQAVESIAPAPFAILVDNLSVEGGTPEAYEVLELFNQWLNTQPLVAKATVSESSVKLKIVDERVPSRQLQNQRSFSTLESARRWLQSEMNGTNN